MDTVAASNRMQKTGAAPMSQESNSSIRHSNVRERESPVSGGHTEGRAMLHNASPYLSSGPLHQWRITISSLTILLGTLRMFCELVVSQVQNMSRRLQEGWT